MSVQFLCPISTFMLKLDVPREQPADYKKFSLTSAVFVYLNRTRKDFRNRLHFDVISMLVILTFSLDVFVEVFGDELGEMIRIFGLTK